jgi:type I site-specific restriction endonuclease
LIEYFGTATQIGLTATLKVTHEVSTTDYFGAPVYTYSLKQGIEDGFLAPYKVVRIDLDKDLDGYAPPVQIYVPKTGESPVPPDDPAPPGEAPKGATPPPVDGPPGDPEAPKKGGGSRVKYVVADVAVYVTSERVQCYGKNGQLVTESLRDYARSAVREEYTSLDGFLKSWTAAERKQAIQGLLRCDGRGAARRAKAVMPRRLRR